MKLVWYDPKADNPPWIEALADVRRMGTLEGYCFHHVQAIMLAIDQYAETALGFELAAEFLCSQKRRIADDDIAAWPFAFGIKLERVIGGVFAGLRFLQ